MNVDPKSWLDYGALGLAGLLTLLSMGLTTWTIRYSFGLVERVNNTFGKLLSKIDDFEERSPR